jgi:dTMP kinase
MVSAIIDVAVGDTRPDVTLLFVVPPEITAERLLKRQSTLSFMRDRIEEADRTFFERVANGYQAIAAAEPQRIQKIDACGTVAEIKAQIWRTIQNRLPSQGN